MITHGDGLAGALRMRRTGAADRDVRVPRLERTYGITARFRKADRHIHRILQEVLSGLRHVDGSVEDRGEGENEVELFLCDPPTLQAQERSARGHRGGDGQYRAVLPSGNE